MQIKTISVTNLGPLKDVNIPCDPLTVLVGQNGVGKSTLLRALQLFYDTSIDVDERDFYNGEIENDIGIKIRFTDLTAKEKELFQPYIKGDELAIEKLISFRSGRMQQTYHGTRFVSTEFAAFRKAKGTEMRNEYNQFKERFNFPNYTNRDVAEKILTAWELEHKNDCIESRDNGQFFGFKNVGKHRLEKHTKYIFVPAVHKAIIEGEEGKGSTISEIMDLVVRGALATDPELLEIEQDAMKKYNIFIERAKKSMLSKISEGLTKSLNTIFPDAKVNIDWVNEQGVAINPPNAFVKVTEEGYENTIDRCGHGLQRAFILTMFQELALIQATQTSEKPLINSETPEDPESEISLPGLIIGIEEPELYLHPDRQRHLAATLLQLTNRGIEGVGKIQVMYSTHSPLMVDYQRFNQLRIIRKDTIEQGKPKQTQVTLANLKSVARLVEDAKELAKDSISEESFRQRLISLMTPWMNEGLFSKLVVLVEGIKDRALIQGFAINNQIWFERMGISVIPCSGKESMTEAISLFISLGIPQYVIWDGDFNPNGTGHGVDANRNIQRCLKCDPEDYPQSISDKFACIKTDLENEFIGEIGEGNYSRILQQYCQENYLGRGKYVMENPIHVSHLLTEFRKEKLESKILGEVVTQIRKKYESL